MEVEAKIKEKVTFDIEINGVIHSDFEVSSTWKNFVCYKNKTGEIIAQKSNSFDTERFLTGHGVQRDPEQLVVISLSPAFIPIPPKD